MNQAIRTLIVDDEEDLRDILEMMLTRMGVEVQLSSNGREAIELLKKEEFDLVISDISMPIMDGVTLLKELRSLTISQPHFIFISGGIDFDDNKKKLIESQTDGVISKPFQRGEILDCFSQIFPLRNFNKI